jgi:hypothetical protein
MKNKNTAKKLGKETFRPLIERYKLDGVTKLTSTIQMEERMNLRRSPAEAADTRDFIQIMEWALEELKA